MFDERDDREMGGRAALEAERPDSRLAAGGGDRRPNKTMADAPVGIACASAARRAAGWRA